MNWQQQGQPHYFPENIQPGMYAADFEQQAFYEQSSQIGETESFNCSVFPNSDRQELNASRDDSTYYPVYRTMPAFPPTYQYFPSTYMYSPARSDTVVDSDLGATGFNNDSAFLNNYSQRGSDQQNKKGRKQSYHNQHHDRRTQRYNEQSFSIDKNEYRYENYADYHGHPQQDDVINDIVFDKRLQRRGGHRDNNSRGRVYNSKDQPFGNDTRTFGNSKSMNTYKKKANDDQNADKREESLVNNNAPFKGGRTITQPKALSSSLRGKHGRYQQSQVQRTSSYAGSSLGSDQQTNITGGASWKRFDETQDNRQLNRKYAMDRRSITVNNIKDFRKGSTFDSSHLQLDKDGRPLNSFSKHKGEKESRNLSPKENDESQRATLTEQLATNKYECMVCCDNVHVEQPIWSCKNCYHVFHLPCIKKWAQSSISQDSRIWRCPGCQNETTYIPNRYFCYCGRRKDPRYVHGEIPHSCGELCRQKRGGDCKHPCTLLCHPGPCPPCSSMVTVKCDCGKVRKSVRCSTKIKFTCNQVCDKKLNCLEHKCELRCHNDPCPLCSVSNSQECFCSKTKRTVICGTNEYAMVSFCCEKPCGRTLNCGNHLCEELCHPGECAPCSLLPENLNYCSCGKTEVKRLNIPQRQTCLDPMPTCTLICNKPMACGSASQPHLCDRPCHIGDCGPCDKTTTLRCECGATEKKMPCEVAVIYNDKNPFKCQKRCGKKKTCGRHKCSNTCCTMEIHICELVCGKKLSCGNHKCEELCHKGNCKRCLQASFDELTCCCGASVIEPPVPCGTRRPECHLPCSREHECNHEVRHQCHGDEKCPPCTELTEKLCMGGHTIRKNIPCHMKLVSCGFPCNKKLPCGQHLCPKKCHDGDCLEDEAVCSQPCQRPRSACNHPCGAPCHFGNCPDTTCKTEITISCSCGNRSAKVQCQAGGDLQSNIAQFQRLSVQSMMESDGQSIDMSQFTQMKKSTRRLDCDTNCAIIERNKRLALALEIKNPDTSAKLGNPTFTEFLVDFARKNPKFASAVEKSFIDLANSSKQGSLPSKNHKFQSMNRDQRHFVHELAEYYGCQTQSYDYEPNKNVVATAVRDKCWLPNISLVDFALKDEIPKKLSSRMGVSLTAMKKEKEEVKEKPSVSRAWETPSWQPVAQPAASLFPVSSSGAAAPSTSTKPAAPVIDYFDFEG